jgi:Tol biopolymer transport system component
VRKRHQFKLRCVQRINEHEIIQHVKVTVIRAACAFLVLIFCSVLMTSVHGRYAKPRLKAIHRASGGTVIFERVPENSGPWPTIDIYSMNADGTDDRALTHDGHSHSPSWSPDGRHILFVHDATLQKPDPYGPYREHGDFKTHHPVELYEMNRDGSAPRLLLRLEPLIDGAAWSPDGKKIIVQAAARPPLGICLFLWLFERPNPPRLLFPYPAAWPAWSPDGKKILFVKRYGPRLSSPFIANTDGSQEAPLKHDPDPEVFEPVWSPDGKRIAYVQDDAPPSRTPQVWVFTN